MENGERTFIENYGMRLGQLKGRLRAKESEREERASVVKEGKAR
jgi:hypothetical protein